jgi:predicted SprT family Zn-dependent metalloprotease
MARTKYINGGTVAGKDGDVLTRCYVCGQPYVRLNQLDTKRNGKLGVEFIEVCDKCAAQLKRNAKRNGKGGK